MCSNDIILLGGIIFASVGLLLMIMMCCWDSMSSFRVVANINNLESNRQNEWWSYDRWSRLLIDKCKCQFQVGYGKSRRFCTTEIV
jgi:hypothetical protein